MIIGLSARKQHGKDTTADYLVSEYGFMKDSLAGPMKESCRILFGLNDEQMYGELKEVTDDRWKVTPRSIMQFMGTEIFRNFISNLLPDIGENFWVNNLENRIKLEFEKNADTRVAVADVRFPNEADAIKRLNGVLIKIIRPSMISDDEHPSEKSIDLINANFTIINDGTLEDLYKKIDDIMNQLNINKSI